MIIVRRTPTVAKTALAGVMLEIFSARSMASIAAFNKETEFSRPFGRWDSVAMVETQGDIGGNDAGSRLRGRFRTLIETGVHSVIIYLVRSGVFGGWKRVVFVAVAG